MNTSRINPMSQNRTEQLYHFYFADLSAGLDEKRSDTIERNLAVVREDYGICVRTHKNYEAVTTAPVLFRRGMSRACITFKSG